MSTLFSPRRKFLTAAAAFAAAFAFAPNAAAYVLTPTVTLTAGQRNGGNDNKSYTENSTLYPDANVTILYNTGSAMFGSPGSGNWNCNLILCGGGFDGGNAWGVIRWTSGNLTLNGDVEIGASRNANSENSQTFKAVGTTTINGRLIGSNVELSYNCQTASAGIVFAHAPTGAAPA
ncbi:MAG: hypothetical protein LBR07_03320, partial [Puniceicoccales bacterium]|nr:hypothetical protein [Puniceicoccales bacterium]